MKKIYPFVIDFLNYLPFDFCINHRHFGLDDLMIKDKSDISTILKQRDLTLTKAQDELNEIKAEKNDLAKKLPTLFIG